MTEGKAVLRHGPLEGQDLSLLTGRSVLLRRDSGAIVSHVGIDRDGKINLGFGSRLRPDRLMYLGERSEDGWISAPEGGWTSNPVPGRTVDYKLREEPDLHETGPADALWWTHGHDGDRKTEPGADIIAFRLSDQQAAQPASEQVGMERSGMDKTPSDTPSRVEGEAPKPRLMDSAPRDCTTVRLLVRYSEDELPGHWTPLDDDFVSWTIGHNNFDNDGEDLWLFVGWDWSQDHYLQAPSGEVIGWLPFHGEGS